MIFRSFKVGNLLEIDGGYTSTVESINTFNSTLATLDNERTFVANCNVAVNNIINISGQGVVRVELTFGIDYSDDVDKARKVILEVGKNCPHILDDPAQGVFVAELIDRSVNLATIQFFNNEYYCDTFFYMQYKVRKEFVKQNIGTPYLAIDSHMISKN